MSVSPPPPAPLTLRAALVWGALPVVVCATLALVVALTGSNEAWFRGGNAVAVGLLPVFLWAGITDLGSAPCALALITPMLAWRPRWIASMLLAALPAACLTNVLKEIADKARPAAVLPLDEIHIIGKMLRTTSFPSGHTLTAFVLAGAVVLCVRRPLAWLMLPFAALVAFSRIAVGAHWPVDLFAGAACGWLMAALGVWWSTRWRFWESVRGQRILAAILLVTALSLYFLDFGYPEGVWMQYLLGCWGSCGALYAWWKPAAARLQRGAL
jgi:membrane-associated phospholipid phosphatase